MEFISIKNVILHGHYIFNYFVYRSCCDTNCLFCVMCTRCVRQEKSGEENT